MYGIDVARVDNDEIDWTEVKNGGKTFAILRAYYRDGPDSDFSRFWPAVRAAGLVRGAYLFMDLTADDPIVEEQAFLSTVGQLGPGDFPPVIDLEQIEGHPWKKDVVLSNMRQLIDAIKGAIGIPPMIYTSERVWNELLANPADTRFSECPLWVVDYEQTAPRCPPEWGAENYWIHQYKDDDKAVRGVTGQADLDRFYPLQLGESGPRAQWLNTRLGLSGNTFDQTTLLAVKQFQQKAGLDVDGIVGPLTWSWLVWHK